MLDELSHVDIPIDNIGYQVAEKKNGQLFPLYFRKSTPIVFKQWEFADTEMVYNFSTRGTSISYMAGFHIMPSLLSAYRLYSLLMAKKEGDYRIIKTGFSDVLATGKQWGEPMIVAKMRFPIEGIMNKAERLRRGKTP